MLDVTTPMNRIYIGQAIEGLIQMKKDGITANTCVTSPPYFGLRSYCPDKVMLKKDAPEWVFKELEKRGIFPIDNSRTSQ